MFEVGSSLQNVLQRETKSCKGFRTFVESETITLTHWKRNYYSIIRKSLKLKVSIHVRLRRTLQNTRAHFLQILFIIISTLEFSCLEFIC